MGTACLAALILLHTAAFGQARACSLFGAEGRDGLLVGRTFDWYDGRGYLLFSPSGQSRSSEGGRSWTSGLASLTWHLDSQGDYRYCTGGINERGLVIEAAMLGITEHGQGPGALSATEWITYNLDNYGSVREVVENVPLNTVAGGSEKLHYLGCDRKGCFVLEYLGGKAAVYDSTSLPYAALTNVAYGGALDSLPSFQGFGGNRGRDGPSPLARFARAAYALSTGGTMGVPGAFDVLGSLRVPSGETPTRWAYVSDTAAPSVLFPDGGRIDMRDLLPGSGRPEKVLILPR